MIRRYAFVMIALLMASATVISNETVKTDFVESLTRQTNTIKPNVWENWRLSEKEWQRYENIIESTPWGHWTHEASPISILAHYSKSRAQKTRYAKLEAEIDQWRHHVVTEYQKLYNREREIISAQYQDYMEQRTALVDNIIPGDRVALFVSEGTCNVRCRAVVKRLMKTQAKMDIYVMDANNRQAIFQWAESADIPVERVKVKQITLNFERDQFTAMSGLPKNAADLPAAFLKTSDDTGYRKVEQL